MRKGFTLIELLVVIAIIAILAGVVLTGVTGFQANARDTKRVGDLKNIQNNIELYFSRCGFYPGGFDAAATPPTCNTTNPADWGDLDGTLNEATGARIPNDPTATTTQDYFYGVSSDNLSYVLGAKLEKPNRVLEDSQEIDSSDLSGSWEWTGAHDALSCDDDNLGYCVGS